MIGKLTRTIVRTFAFALALCATGGAWAAVPVPTAVWDGNFGTNPNSRYQHHWTLDPNGNTVAANGSTITITSKGIKLTPAAAVTAGKGVTVLVKMSGITKNDNNDQILVCAKQNNVDVKTGTAVCMGAMTMHGSWDGNTKWVNDNNGETTFVVPASGEFYVVFTTGNSSTTVREGIYANGAISVKEISGLRDSANAVQMITIGGQPSGEGSRADNAVISRIMVYEGCLTSDQMKAAIEDIESDSLIYTLPRQADGNKGALDCANFQLPYNSVYQACGSATLKTDKALRSIIIPWRPDSNVSDNIPSSLYLGITDSNNKLLAISSGADMTTVAVKSSTPFYFSQTYLVAGTQYKYWFLSSNNYAIGDTITADQRMGCSLYNCSSDSKMCSNTMPSYAPAAWFWASNMTESEFTATAVGTAVSTSGAYADDITLKGVADGKFTVGELKAARIKLADAEVKIEMDSGDSIKAQYLDNSSQKLVIDASNGATAVGTYTLFEGTLASAADANLEVTFPTLGSGYDLRATKTANTISYLVDRTAVNATLTLTSNCNFSEVKDNIEWIDSYFSTLEIVNNQESPITLTFDGNITAGSITVSGTGSTIIESSNSAVITAGTVTIPSGSIINATGASITTCAGSGTFVWTAGYPTTVPQGSTYKFIGSNDSANPTAYATAITVNGKLETSGYLNLSGANKIATTGELKVLDGRTKMVAGSNANGICGTLTIEPGATFENATTDGLHFGGSPTVNVYGTLDMASTRWTLGSATLNFYAGSTITGGHKDNGALDSNSAKTFNVLAKAGQDAVNLSATLRPRDAQTFNIAANVTVNCTGKDSNEYTNPISITGSGKFKIATGASFTSKVTFNVASTATLELAGGTIASSITGTGNLSVVSGTYEPSFSSFTGPISVSGSGTVLTLASSQITASSGITVGTGSTLKIKVTDEVIAIGFDASSKVSNSGGTVMFVDSSGTQITENVSQDGETLSPAVKVLYWDGTSWSEDDDFTGYTEASIAVSGETSVTLPASLNLQKMTLTGSSGSLTIVGNNNTLTVGDVIIPNGVTLNAASELTVEGTISGDGSLVIPNGVTFANAAGSTWNIGDSGSTGAVLTVEDGGELVINGTVNLTTHFGGRATGVVVEKDAVLRVNSTGTLYTDDYWEVMQISGRLIITGTVNFRGDAINVLSGGSIDLSGAGTMFSGYGLSNSGTITVPRFAYYVFGGSKFTNNDGGTYVLRPTDSTVGATISNLSSYMDNSGTIMFDASLLTKPTGTASVTLVTISSTSLTLGADSLTGCSADYYVKQDATTGAVTLQLHAAKDSKGVYYDDVADAFDAIVEDNTLTVTILDGTEESYVDTLASNGLGRNGTKIFFLVAEVTFADDSVVQCASLDDAYDVADANPTYKYITIIETGTFYPKADYKYIVPAGATPTSSSPEYGAPVASEPDANGAVTYNLKAVKNPTTYTWKVDAATRFWQLSSNWKNSADETADRTLIPEDSVIINVDTSGNPIQIVSVSSTINAISVGNTVALSASSTDKTLTATSGAVLTTETSTLTISGTLTLSGTVTTTVADKCVKWVYGESSKTYSVADPVAEIGGVKYGSLANAIEVATDAGLASITVTAATAEVPEGYYLVNNNTGIAKYQAAIVDESAGVHYYATVDGAVTDFLGSYLLTKTYDHFEIYSSTNVVVNVNAASDVLNNNSLKIKCTEAGVSATLSPTTVEYEFVAGDPDESGIITYTRQQKATTYVWVGTTATFWARTDKWNIGMAEGAAATRVPAGNDTVILNDGAAIIIRPQDSNVNVSAMVVSGDVKITSTSDKSIAVASSINLATAGASLKVSGVTISPYPTTSVAGRAVSSSSYYIGEDYYTEYSVVAAGATIGDTGYLTLGDAITAASNGATITLAADCNTANINLGGKSITFNEGSYTFTGSFTGNGTLVLTALLKSAATARWAEGWTGTVWLRNYTDLTGESKQGSNIWGATNFEPNNYGNSNSTVRFTGVKGYLTANDDGSYTIQPALELEDDGDTPGLLLYNGWGYNSNAQCYTIIRELKGSGTLAADTTLSGTSIPGLNVLLQVRKWDNFTGTLNMPNKNIVFGSTLPAQSVVEGGGHIVVQSGAVVTVPTGKTWTAANGFVVSGAIKSEAELTVTSGDASMRLSEATDGGYHVYVLLPSPSEVTTTTFDFNAFTYGDLPVTLEDGDTIIVPSNCEGNQWHPSLLNAAGHPVIVRKEMNWKAGIGTMTIDSGVTVYAYGDNGTALNDSGSVISGSGTLALQDSVPVNGVASVLCTISGEGSFLLRNRNAMLTVSSPLPAGKVTTFVTGAKVISESVDAGTRYRVVYGTIFSVY